MPRVYKNKGEKNLWSDEQLYADIRGLQTCKWKLGQLTITGPWQHRL